VISKFNLLYKELCGEPQVSYDRFREIRHELKHIGDFSDDLLKAVNEQLQKKNWGCLHRLIFVMQISPNKKYTEILCYLLSNHREQGFADAIADTLFDIKDEKAIPTLKNSLNYYEPGDDDFNFNKKVLYALEEIKTINAFDAIKLALELKNDVIRETAKEILERNNMV
jgi:HEAT repeat protein